MTKKIAPKVEYEKYTLPNGLQVILHIDRKLPIVHINRWFSKFSDVRASGRVAIRSDSNQSTCLRLPDGTVEK